MKLVVSATLLALLMGAPAFAKQEPDRDKPQDEPRKQDQPRKQEPERQQPQDKEKQQQQDKAQADRARQNDKQERQQQQQTEKDRARQDKTAQDRAPQAQRDEHGNGAQGKRDAGNRRDVREEDFRAHFGREHTFRVARRDDRRFNYGGYWFVYDDPWPPAWSYSDDVYVDEIDGEYYLIDPVHPGIRLLVIVSD